MGKYIAGIALVLAVGLILFWQKPQTQEEMELPLVRVGIQTTPSIALVKVAAEKKFFEEEGLNVEIQEFTAGKFALQALLGRSLDLATPAEFPVTLATLNGEKLAILSEINETIGGFPMVLRKEGDTFDAPIYFSKKRKIATSIGGGPEYFTHDFFRHFGVDISQHEIVAMKPEDMPIALANGSVDGVAIFEPFAHFAIVQTGQEKVFAIKSEQFYSETMVLAGKKEWIAGHQKRKLEISPGSRETEAFSREHPDEAIQYRFRFSPNWTWKHCEMSGRLSHYDSACILNSSLPWSKKPSGPRRQESEAGDTSAEFPRPDFRSATYKNKT